MKKPIDELLSVKKAGLFGLVVLGFVGLLTYVKGDNASSIEQFIIVAFVLLLAVVLGAVIVIESRKDS